MHVLAPAMVALAATLAAAALHRRLRPSFVVRSMTALAALTALAVLWSLALITVDLVGHIAGLAYGAPWCLALGGAHEAIPSFVAGVASVAFSASVVSIWRCLRRRSNVRIDAGDDDGELLVLPSEAPTAYALPGRSGRIVVSTGMLRALDVQERRVLLAHERSHLLHRHDRYALIADLAAAAVPLLRPISQRVRFSIERWADEEAARAVGDRRIAARAIARAALAVGVAPAPPALAATALGVPARVEALLEPSGGVRRAVAVVGAVGAGLVAVSGSTVQFHHLLEVAAHLCA